MKKNWWELNLGYDHVQAYLGICKKNYMSKKYMLKKIYVKKSRSCDIFAYNVCLLLLLVQFTMTAQF
jgi:hypothetical protein